MVRFRSLSFSLPYDGGNGDGGGVDRLLWWTDIGRRAAGEFSMAIVQANSLMEDGSQIESGPLAMKSESESLGLGTSGTFVRVYDGQVGVYDGHGGPETSRYIGENLFRHLKRFTSKQQAMFGDVIHSFLSYRRRLSIYCEKVVSGDSRVVLGRIERGIREVHAVQLSEEHNSCHESVRDELCSLHPEDSKIVVLKHQLKGKRQ